MSREEEQPLWLNTEAMDELVDMPAADLGLAMKLVFVVWWPNKEPFHFDPAALFELLKGKVKGLTVEQIEESREGAARLFVILPDGRWAPSPEFFSLTDGNDGGHVV